MNGNTFELTQKEFEILRELLTHQGRILTRQNLLDKLWRYDFYGDERVVDTPVSYTHLENEEIVDIVRGMSVSLEELPLVLQRLRDSGTSGQSVQKSEDGGKEEN